MKGLLTIFARLSRRTIEVLARRHNINAIYEDDSGKIVPDSK
jgi:hypothetical protein